MIVINVKTGKRTPKLISVFKQSLGFNNLSIIEQHHQVDGESIELFINAEYFPQIQRVTSLAQRCFLNCIISIKNAPVVNELAGHELVETEYHDDKLAA
jgi:hypothetical protein